MRELWTHSGSSDIGRQHGWILPLLPRPVRWRRRFGVVGRTDRGSSARTTESGQQMNDDVPVVVDVPTTAGSLVMGFPVLDFATGSDDMSISDVSCLEDDDCGAGADHGDEPQDPFTGRDAAQMLFGGEYQTSGGTFDSTWGMTTWCILDGQQHEDENRSEEDCMDQDGYTHHHRNGRQQRAWTWSETRPRTDLP